MKESVVRRGGGGDGSVGGGTNVRHVRLDEDDTERHQGKGREGGVVSFGFFFVVFFFFLVMHSWTNHSIPIPISILILSFYKYRRRRRRRKGQLVQQSKPHTQWRSIMSYTHTHTPPFRRIHPTLQSSCPGCSAEVPYVFGCVCLFFCKTVRAIIA